MDDKRPIPVPPAQRWREFRIQLLPFVVFIIVVVIIAMIWKQVVLPVSLTGEVSSVQYQVRSLVDGTLTELTVEPFTVVKKGEQIGSVLGMEPALVQAEMAVALADLELERLKTGMGVSRNLLEVTTLELEKQKIAADLEINRADVTLKKSEFETVKAQFEKKLVSKEFFDEKSIAYDKARTTVEQLASQLTAYEAQLKGLREAASAPSALGQDQAIDKAIAAHTNQLAVLARPVPLIAPADGVVSLVSFRPGEKVRAGDPIVIVTSTNVTHIIGYIRQPVYRMPNVNDEVRVRTRRQDRSVASARVLKVAPQFEYLNPALVSPDNTRLEKALSVLVSLPAGMTLRPGEFVDLMFTGK
jgi:multidrug resistance efflux pump